MLGKHPVLSRALVLCLLSVSVMPLHGRSWSSRLADGDRIEVDSNTNRVTVFSKGGVSSPLWDGVHRLEDGSTITIRSGIMVPNREVLELRQRVPEPGAAEIGASCQQLVRKVCGLHDECASHPACGPARQLLQMQRNEGQEAAAHPEPAATPWTSRQCQQALEDEAFFAPCDQPQRSQHPTPCEQLFDKVCGGQNQCAHEPRCPLVKQMLDMEAEERQAATNPDAFTFTSGQCQEALADEVFFNPCQH